MQKRRRYTRRRFFVSSQKIGCCCDLTIKNPQAESPPATGGLSLISIKIACQVLSRILVKRMKEQVQGQANEMREKLAAISDEPLELLSFQSGRTFAECGHEYIAHFLTDVDACVHGCVVETAPTVLDAHFVDLSALRSLYNGEIRPKCLNGQLRERAAADKPCRNERHKNAPLHGSLADGAQRTRFRFVDTAKNRLDAHSEPLAFKERLLKYPPKLG